VAVLLSDSIKNHDCETAETGLKQLYGCDEPLQKGLEYELRGYKFNRCPNWYARQALWVSELIEIWEWKEKGFLPVEGTYLDLPNKLYELLVLVDHLIVERRIYAARQRTSNKASTGRQGSTKQTQYGTK
jgi:hypothetical protein